MTRSAARVLHAQRSRLAALSLIALAAGGAAAPGRLSTPTPEPAPAELAATAMPDTDPSTPASSEPPAADAPLEPTASAAGESGSDTHRVVPNPAFAAGEKLVFSVEFLGISAGRATLEITDVVDLGPARAYRLVSDSRTNSFFDRIYRVRNRYESFIDVERLCSWKYLEHQQEKGTFRHRVSDYDQIGHLATVTRYPVQKSGKPKNEAEPKVETTEIPPFVQDVLSSMYHLRTQKLEVGKEYRLPAISGVKNYELIVRVPRRETIKTPAGTFETLELVPELKYEGLFLNKGKSYCYVTDDERKMPVLLKSKVAVGAFKAVLVEKTVPVIAGGAP